VETIPDTRYESLGFDRVISFGHSKSYFEFRNKLLEAIDKKANDRFKKELETVPNNADSIQILERLSDVLLQAHKDTSEWEAFLLAQKFIFPSIGGVMTELTWHIAHKICDIVQKRIPNSADELKAVIREQIKASPNDFSLEYRGECLIHQYLGSQN
ncbi:MAG: hypothetical protein FWD49_04030, partial [Firmicutes bacterium]|nr:hypothetical protein [Bacillota bacterium]